MTYIYKCNCGKIIELSRNIIDRDNSVKCECGAEMRRQITPPEIQFKGKGFYKTDAKPVR